MNLIEYIRQILEKHLMPKISICKKMPKICKKMPILWIPRFLSTTSEPAHIILATLNVAFFKTALDAKHEDQRVFDPPFTSVAHPQENDNTSERRVLEDIHIF